MGQRMEKKYETKTKKKSGYIQQASVYQAQRCEGCPLRGACHKSKEDRKIKINHNLARHKRKGCLFAFETAFSQSEFYQVKLYETRFIALIGSAPLCHRLRFAGVQSKYH